MSDDAMHDRILSALERVEGRLSALEEKVNGMSGGGNAALPEVLSRPDVVEGLNRILLRMDALEDVASALEVLVERAPIIVDGTAEVVDAFMNEAAGRGVDVFQRGELGLGLLEKATRPETMALAESLLDDDVVKNLSRLAEVASSPAFEKLLDSGLLDPAVLGTAGSATTALVDARSGGIQPVGLFGTLGKLGDKDVQKAVGFAFALAKRFGAAL